MALADMLIWDDSQSLYRRIKDVYTPEASVRPLTRLRRMMRGQLTLQQDLGYLRPGIGPYKEKLLTLKNCIRRALLFGEKVDHRDKTRCKIIQQLHLAGVGFDQEVKSLGSYTLANASRVRKSR